jgi:uncharacterized damage-inducible protein DinB
LPSAQEFAAALVGEARVRLFDESVPRLKKCLGLLTEEEIWRRPNDQLVSVGDLVLHLCGNVRQWMGTGLGGLHDDRDRDSEFAQKEPLPRSELLHRLDTMERDIRQVLDQLDFATLLQPRRVQCFDVTGVSILVHATEHFSYHVGQVSYYTKLVRGVSLDYYPEKGLSQTTPR